jgi:hypothetical protein
MKVMIKSFFHIIIISAFINPFNVCANSSNEYEQIMSLHHPKACDVERYKFDHSGVIQLRYTVKLPYPSLEVLKYYDSELKKLGWQSFKPPYFDNPRKWEPVWDGSIKGVPLTHRLDSYWIDKKKRKVVVLMLEYRSYNITKEDVFNNVAPNNDSQKVILQIGEYSELVPPSTKPTG